jgi:hypothetical protein
MLGIELNKKAVTVLLAVGFLFFIGGLVTATEIALGSTLVGAACFFGIVARIIQAEVHQTENVEIHDDDVEALEKQP